MQMVLSVAGHHRARPGSAPGRDSRSRANPIGWLGKPVVLWLG